MAVILRVLILLLLSSNVYASDNLSGRFRPVNFQHAEWQENDAGSNFTVDSKTKITVTSLPRTASANYYRDFGPSYFSGNFSITCEVVITGVTDAGSAPMGAFVGLSDTANITFAAVGNAVYMRVIGDGTNTEEIGTSAGDMNVSSNTRYYCKMERIGSTVTHYVYSNPGYTTLVSSNSTTDATAFRYLYVVISRGGTGSATVSYTVENMRIRV